MYHNPHQIYYLHRSPLNHHTMQSTMMQRHCISTNNASSQRMLSKTRSLAGKPLVGCTSLPVRSARTTVKVAADKDPFKEASLKQRRTVRGHLWMVSRSS